MLPDLNQDPSDKDSFLRNLFGLGSQLDPEYEPLTLLSPEDLKEWNDLQKKMFLLKADVKEFFARRELFWARLEKTTQIFDRGLRIENDMIMVEKKSSAKNEGGNSNNPFDL
jgi:hypothetical protein